MSEQPDYGYFWEITLENVRCFGPAQTLELHRDSKISKWTVILGDNGVGKTTLLQCLHGMAPMAVEIRSGVQPPGWGHIPRVYKSTKWATDTLPRGDLEAKVTSKITVNEYLTDPPKEPIANYMNCRRESSSFTSMGSSPMFTMFCCGYGASRKSTSLSLDKNDSDSAATLFDEQATLLAADEWFLQSDYAAISTKSQSAVARADAIRLALIDLLPDVDDLRVAGLEAQPPRPTLEALTPYGWVRVRDLSLGYRTLMAWVVDFAARMFARYPNSENPLAEPAVCLVDEIDLHLHPAWQRKLISFLDERFPKTQFIVTAHSPLVVQAAEHAKVAVLRRHDGDDFVTIHNDLDAVRGWRVDQILTSDLFGLDGSRSPRINELMHERAALLGKPALDDDDRAQLAKLDAELSTLPLGDTTEDRKAWDLVQRFANVLRSEAADE